MKRLIALTIVLVMGMSGIAAAHGPFERMLHGRGGSYYDSYYGSRGPFERMLHGQGGSYYGFYRHSDSIGPIIAIGNIGLGVYEATLQAQATQRALDIAEKEQDLRYQANQQQQKSYVSQADVGWAENQKLRVEVKEMKLRNEKFQEEMNTLRLEVERIKLQRELEKESQQQKDAQAKKN